MTNVLLAVDRDERRAIAQAEQVVSLWEPADVQVTVLHVFTENEGGAAVNQLASARRAYETLEEAGFEVRYDERSGDPAPTVVRYTGTEEVDLVCLAGRDRTPAGKAVFGSVSQSIMLNAEVPVLFCSVGDGER